MAGDSEQRTQPERGERSRGERPARGGWWDGYWDRFRRQEVDEPIERVREGYWERFKRQQVDDPVDERNNRRRST